MGDAMKGRRGALLGGSALLLLLAVGAMPAARAADECGVVAPGGTATCNATSYPLGITYLVDDITVNVGAAAGQPGAVTITTAADNSAGVSNGQAGMVLGSLTTNVTGDVTITTSGNSASGILTRSNDAPVTVVSAADITISGTGFGILAAGHGIGQASRLISTGDINILGAGSGIVLAATDAYARISGSVTTQQNNSDGIRINAGTGVLDFASSAEVTTHGVHARGIDVNAVTTGLATVTGAVTTYGANSAAVYTQTDAQLLTITVQSQLDTRGDDSAGVYVFAFLGETAVNMSGDVVTVGTAAHGIYAKHSYYGFTARLEGTITTSGAGSHGIYASYGFGVEADNDITVESGGRITVSGDGADAIRTSTNCDYYITLGCASSRITVSGEATSNADGGFGIAAFGVTDMTVGYSTVEITITGAGDVIGGSGIGGGINLQIPLATVSIAGRLTAASDLAIQGDDGIADIDSSGIVVGRMTLGGGDDRFDNLAGGAWYARSGDSDFGSGSDTLANAGLVSVIGSQSWHGIDTLTNSGRISLQEVDAGAFNTDPGTFETLTIAGDFNGGGGRLALDTYLGDDISPSDVVVIQGTVTGTTEVEIANAGGPGAVTQGSGIRVIDVSQGSTTPDNFALAGPTQAGAFAYDLVLEPDGIWYLQSRQVAGEQLTPYVAAQLVALNGWLLETGALHERLGELRDQLGHPGGQSAALGASDLQEASAFGGYGGERPQGAWLRALGAGLRLEPDGSLPIRQSSSGLQGGYDVGWRGALSQDDLLLLGGSLGLGSHSGALDGSDAEVELFGPTFGLYATYLVDGWHADLVAHADLLTATLSVPSSGTDDSTLVTTAGGSLEVGYRADFGGFYLEPQAQIAYAHSWSGDLEDGSGAAILLDGASSLQGRLGARIGGPLDLGGWRVKPYLEANAHHEFLGEAKVTVTGVTATSDLGGTFGSVGGGLETDAWGGHLSFYLDVDYLFGGKTEGVAGIVGARLAW